MQQRFACRLGFGGIKDDPQPGVGLVRRAGADGSVHNGVLGERALFLLHGFSGVNGRSALYLHITLLKGKARLFDDCHGGFVVQRHFVHDFSGNGFFFNNRRKLNEARFLLFQLGQRQLFHDLNKLLNGIVSLRRKGNRGQQHFAGAADRQILLQGNDQLFFRLGREHVHILELHIAMQQRFVRFLGFGGVKYDPQPAVGLIRRAGADGSVHNGILGESALFLLHGFGSVNDGSTLHLHITLFKGKRHFFDNRQRRFLGRRLFLHGFGGNGFSFFNNRR